MSALFPPETLLVIALAAVALVVAIGWRSRRQSRALAELEARCRHLEMSLAAANRMVQRLGAERKDRQAALAALNESIARSSTQIEQLRDLVKVHVARRREFDEWAGPIRASLGEGIGKVLQALKERVARQEFSMQRQERVVAEAKDQYRAKRDDLERLRRELTLKNYHIAALNERFIRIEERIEELTAELGVTPSTAPAASPPPTLGSGEAAPQPAALRPRAESPETERFTLTGDADKDWMGILDDWQRQLQERFERLGRLQAQVRGTAPKPPADNTRDRDDSAA